MIMVTEKQALRILRFNWIFRLFGFKAWWRYEYFQGRLVRSEIKWLKANKNKGENDDN